MTKLMMRHYTDVRPNWYPWTYFEPHELASKGNGAVQVEYTFLDRLQSLRIEWDEPMFMNSVYRDPVHNARVGGAPLSKHKEGKAGDVRTSSWDLKKKYRFKEMALKHGFTGFGGYNTFIHIDIGRPRKWGQTWAWPKSYGGK